MYSKYRIPIALRKTKISHQILVNQKQDEVNKAKEEETRLPIHLEKPPENFEKPLAKKTRKFINFQI